MRTFMLIAVLAAGLQQALPGLADDVEWSAAGDRERLPWAGTWRGKAGVTEFFRILNSEMKYEKFEAVREYQFRAGRIVRVRNFYDTAAYERALRPPEGQDSVTIDHLILGISDLERGMGEFEAATGVRPVVGGVHPGRGTRNALASLGDTTYIEIIAPDPKQTVDSPMVAELKSIQSLKPVGWALAAQDVFAVQARLRAREIEHGAAMPGSRALPDGSRLRWSTFSVTRPAHAWLPFFIHWADADKQPARTSPRGCSLVSVQLRDPNPDPLTMVLRAAGNDTAVERGESRMTVTIDCPKGRVSFIAPLR